MLYELSTSLEDYLIQNNLHYAIWQEKKRVVDIPAVFEPVIPEAYQDYFNK